MGEQGTPKIVVDGVWKSFKLPHQRETSMKSRVISLARAPQTVEQQQVLKDVSFEIAEGEFFGIIGRNGSGKSTLLKLLAGIYVPNRGTVTVRGAVTPFIELGVGFSPELTGRENVFLNGALLGFDHGEVEAIYEDIVAFAELDRFMDLKLKNYSSGMQVRLAFSIAVRTEPDVLLIDEVLAVGDASFQQKCFNYFYELKQSGRTIVFVSHDTEAVQRYCDRAVYIDDGVIREAGTTEDIVNAYLLDVFRHSDNEEAAANDEVGSIPARMLSCSITPKELDSSGVLSLLFSYEIVRPTRIELRFAFVKDGIAFGHVSTRDKILDDTPGVHQAEFRMHADSLMDGRHVVTGGVFHVVAVSSSICTHSWGHSMCVIRISAGAA